MEKAHRRLRSFSSHCTDIVIGVNYGLIFVVAVVVAAAHWPHTPEGVLRRLEEDIHGGHVLHQGQVVPLVGQREFGKDDRRFLAQEL